MKSRIEGNSQAEKEFLRHTASVLPGIITGLVEKNAGIISIDINAMKPLKVRVHIFNQTLPDLKEWAEEKGLEAVVSEFGHDDVQAVYTIDDVEVFTILKNEDKDKHFPNN